MASVVAMEERRYSCDNKISGTEGWVRCIMTCYSSEKGKREMRTKPGTRCAVGAISCVVVT